MLRRCCYLTHKLWYGIRAEFAPRFTVHCAPRQLTCFKIANHCYLLTILLCFISPPHTHAHAHRNREEEAQRNCNKVSTKNICVCLFFWLTSLVCKWVVRVRVYACFPVCVCVREWWSSFLKLPQDTLRRVCVACDNFKYPLLNEALNTGVYARSGISLM